MQGRQPQYRDWVSWKPARNKHWSGAPSPGQDEGEQHLQQVPGAAGDRQALSEVSLQGIHWRPGENLVQYSMVRSTVQYTFFAGLVEPCSMGPPPPCTLP